MDQFKAALFDAVVDDYDEAVPFFATFGRRLVDWAPPRPGAAILDLGAGKGAVTVAVLNALGPNVSLLAVDLSPKMVAHLGSLALPGVSIRRMDAAAIDLPDASLDVVFSGFVFHILDDPAAALGEVCRVLKPGGVFALSVPGPSADGGWWSRYGQTFASYQRRVAGVVPAGMAARGQPWPDQLVAAGLQPAGSVTTEVALPIGGPEQLWDWLMSHGNRWLYGALDDTLREQFRHDVLQDLREVHPTQGRTLIAGATFYKATNHAGIGLPGRGL